MVIVIIGFTGQGKSTLAEHLARKADTVLIVDPRSQFHTTSDIIPDAAELYEMLNDRTEIIVQPGRGRSLEDVFDRSCTELANWIEDNPTERIAFVPDEGRLLGLDSKSVPLDFDWIVRSAREGSPIDVIITCHRPVDVSTNIRAIANRLIYFPMMLPSDLVLVEDQCGPIVAEQVRTLKERQFVVWNNSRQQWRKITDPQSWFVQLSEKPTVGYVQS